MWGKKMKKSSQKIKTKINIKKMLLKNEIFENQSINI